MTQRLTVHPTHPQLRLLRQAVQLLRDGGVLALPTDACYVLACHLGDKQAVDALLARKKSGAIALDVDWKNPARVSAFVCLFVSSVACTVIYSKDVNP